MEAPATGLLIVLCCCWAAALAQPAATTAQQWGYNMTICPDAGKLNWRTLENGGKYHFSTDLKFKWVKAKFYCEMRDGTLVTVGSQEEMKLLWNVIKTIHDQGFWVSASDFSRPSNVFHWSDATKLDSNRPWWGENQPPVPSRIVYKETCVQTWESKLWKAACEEEHLFICKLQKYCELQ